MSDWTNDHERWQDALAECDRLRDENRLRGQERDHLRACMMDAKGNVEALAEIWFDGDWGVASAEERDEAFVAIGGFLTAIRARAGVKP